LVLVEDRQVGTRASSRPRADSGYFSSLWSPCCRSSWRNAPHLSPGRSRAGTATSSSTTPGTTSFSARLRRKRRRIWLRHSLTWRVLGPAGIRKRRVSVGRCLWLIAGIRIRYWRSGLWRSRWSWWSRGSRGRPMFGRWRLGHQVVLPRARWVRCRADSVIRPAP